jgi:hypothetical protein
MATTLAVKMFWVDWRVGRRFLKVAIIGEGLGTTGIKPMEN